METVRGDTGPQDRPFQSVENYQSINDKSPLKAENEANSFEDSQVSSPKQIASYFNRQFTKSKLGRHTSSRETRLVSREILTLISSVSFI